MGLTSTLRLSLNNAISFDSAASSPSSNGKSPLLQRVAKCAAAVAQSSFDVARIALFRCHGVICWSPPDVNLRTSFTAFRMSSAVTESEGKFSGASVSGSWLLWLSHVPGVPRTVWSFSSGIIHPHRSVLLSTGSMSILLLLLLFSLLLLLPWWSMGELGCLSPVA